MIVIVNPKKSNTMSTLVVTMMMRPFTELLKGQMMKQLKGQMMEQLKDGMMEQL